MEIIHAVWENRNLGRDVYEVTLDKIDLDNFIQVQNELEAFNFGDAYITVKMPVGNLECLHQLQNMGFYFMETQMLVSRKLKDYEPPFIYKRILSAFDYIKVPKNKESWSTIVSNITSSMFTSDRIRLDPKLNNDVSSTRYKNWCLDLVDDENAHMFTVNKDEVTIGMGVIKGKNSKISEGIIGGIFDSKAFSGAGVSTLDAPLSVSKKMGFDTYKTSISSNNISVLKIYFSLGFKLENEFYILRKF